MTSQQFEKLYTANEEYLKKTLTKQDIYDDDLFQDTCLALCEHLQDIAVEDFRQAFLDKYYKHPQPGERDHKRACRILRLYLKGRSFREIANTMKLDVATVYKYFTRTVERLKANTLCKYYRGA